MAAITGVMTAGCPGCIKGIEPSLPEPQSGVLPLNYMHHSRTDGATVPEELSLVKDNAGHFLLAVQAVVFG